MRYKTKALVQVAVALMADPMGQHWGYDITRKDGETQFLSEIGTWEAVHFSCRV